MSPDATARYNFVAVVSSTCLATRWIFQIMRPLASQLYTSVNPSRIADESLYTVHMVSVVVCGRHSNTLKTMYTTLATIPTTTNGEMIRRMPWVLSLEVPFRDCKRGQGTRSKGNQSTHKTIQRRHDTKRSTVKVFDERISSEC